MNCEQFQQQISRMFDGMLDPADQGHLFEHLAGCGDCRNFYASVNRIRLSFRQVSPVTIPSAVDAAVTSVLSDSGGSREIADRPAVRRSLWHRTIPVPVPSLLLFVIMLLVGSLVFSSSRNGGLVAREQVPPELVRWQQSLSGQ